MWLSAGLSMVFRKSPAGVYEQLLTDDHILQMLRHGDIITREAGHHGVVHCCLVSVRVDFGDE